MAKSREQFIQELNLAVQRQGTLTVLFTHAIAQHIGLSASEFEFCDVLQSHGPTTAGEMAKLCGLSTGGVTGLVDRLEKAGMLRRTAHAHDRRKVVLEPIVRDDHIRTVRRLYQPLSHGFLDLVAHYSDQELATIVRFVTEASQMVEQLHHDLAAPSPAKLGVSPAPVTPPLPRHWDR